jgi:hypothetical protein
LLRVTIKYMLSFFIQREEECQAALSLFNGRWYAGRQLQCEFCPVTRWKMAICGKGQYDDFSSLPSPALSLYIKGYSLTINNLLKG